jgi:MFS family permease
MVVLDIAIVNVALPSIGRDLDFAEDNLQWVITAYTLTFGGFLLLGGRAADLLGRRRMFMIGVGFFALASLACGLANSEATLIVARAVQGLGAAIISPAVLSIITTTFTEGAERNKALGVWGGVGGSGAAAGVLFGGLLTKYLGWEWIFFVNVPIGLAGLTIARLRVEESRNPDARGIDDRREAGPPPDAPGHLADDLADQRGAVRRDQRRGRHPSRERHRSITHHVPPSWSCRVIRSRSSTRGTSPTAASSRAWATR